MKMLITDQIEVSYQGLTVDEYLSLRQKTGLSQFSREAAEIGLSGSLFEVTLRLKGTAVGMGRLIGDGGCFVQVVDIAVDPQFQGQGLGKKVMSELMTFAKNNLPSTAFMSLLADVPANKLYEQYGFEETAPISLGMSFRVKKS